MKKKEEEGDQTSSCIKDNSYYNIYSPVIIIKDNESFISSSKSHLVTTIVPPVCERLPINYITEHNHVPKNKISNKKRRVASLAKSPMLKKKSI